MVEHSLVNISNLTIQVISTWLTNFERIFQQTKNTWHINAVTKLRDLLLTMQENITGRTVGSTIVFSCIMQCPINVAETTENVDNSIVIGKRRNKQNQVITFIR